MITFFILSAFVLANANPTTPLGGGTTASSPLSGGGCLEYTVDRCDFGAAYETTNDENIQFCSFICNTQSECTFFLYDYQKEQCNHYNTSIVDFGSNCDEVAGPSTQNEFMPKEDQCKTLANPCKVPKQPYPTIAIS